MVNLEHKLTVDDLIVIYMTEKVKQGYSPSYTKDEFMDFLNFFITKVDVLDVLEDKNLLFERFFERKRKHDWSNLQKEYHPHIEMNGDLIIANYKLSPFDESIINTYFMTKKEQEKVIEITTAFLINKSKREITDKDVSINNLYYGKCCASVIISYIWEGYRKEYIKNQKWPIQCRSIDEFLLDNDLAKIIGLPSIRESIIEFYQIISKRIAILLENDPNLKIKNRQSSFLAYSNYLCVFSGYDELLKYCKDKIIELDFEKMKITETHEYDAVYAWDDDPDYVSTSVKIGDDAKNLVNSLDNVKKI